MKTISLALAATLLAAPVLVDVHAAPPPKSSAPADEALTTRVRARLAETYGSKRAARISISVRGGAVRVVAPELAARDRVTVENAVRAVPGVTGVMAVVGTVTRPPAPTAAGIIGEKGRVTTNTAGVIGEKSRVPVHTAGIIGEKSRVPIHTAGIIGEKSRAPAAGIIGEKGRAPAVTGIIGEKGRAAVNTTGVIGEKSRTPIHTVGIIGEKSKVQPVSVIGISDAALASAARERLTQRLGAKAAARLRIHVRSGVILVEPLQDPAPRAHTVADALSGLAGMQRLDNRLTP